MEDKFCLNCGGLLSDEDVDISNYKITVTDRKSYNAIAFKLKIGNSVACRALVSKLTEENNGKGLETIPEDSYLLDYITTEEKYRGKGLLKILLSYVENWIKFNKKAKNIVLFPQKDSVTPQETLIAIYTKLGYKNFEKGHMIKKLR